MATKWEIEYRGTLADDAASGDKRTLAAWGIAGLPDLSFRNLARGGLTLELTSATTFVSDLPWSYRDKIVVWRDDGRFWHGWLVRAPRSTAPESDLVQLEFGDPYWILEQTAMTDPMVENAVTGSQEVTTNVGTITLQVIQSVDWAEPTGNITWTWREQSTWTVQGQIRRALYAATRNSAPINLGPIGIDAPAPAQESRGSTALSYLQSAVAYEPLAVGWWDYSGSTPTLHIQPRSALGAVSYALGSRPTGVTCEPLYDLQARAVRIRWKWTRDDGSEATYTETAGDDSLPIGPNVLVIDAEASDHDSFIEAYSFGIAARMLAALSPLAYAGSVTLTNNLTALATALPGVAINLTGGRAEWETMAGIIQSVTINVTPEADTLTAVWGAPRHLGLQDWQALRDIGGGSAANAHWDNTGGGTDDDGPFPGTIDDLNGTPPAVTPDGTITIQSLGGTWSLVGYPTFDGSSPTVRYRKRTNSGAHEWVGTPSFPYNSTTCVHRYAYTGANTYDAVTGLCSGDRLRTWSISGDGVGTAFPCLTSFVSPGDTTCGCETAVYCGILGDVADTTITPTVWTRGVSTSGPDWTGEAVVTLSSQDTEDDAWARLVAATDWTVAVTTAIRTVPATVATGKRRRLRWGTYSWVGTPAVLTYTPITGLAVWQRYRCRATVQRRPVDESGTATGAWTDAGTVYSPAFTAGLDGAGGWEWADVIEPTAGYESQLTDITLEVY